MPLRTLRFALLLAAAALALGFVPSASAQYLVPYFNSNGFEPPGYVLGNANGQNGWTAAGSIVNTTVNSGTQAARTFGGPATGFSHAITLGSSKVVLDLDVLRVTTGRTIFYLGNNFIGAAAYIGIASGGTGYMIGYPGTGDGPAQHSELPANEWRHLRIVYDYNTLLATGFVDGLSLGSTPISYAPGFTPNQLQVAVGELNQDVYFDNLTLSNAADYSVTTAGGVMTATDFSGFSDNLSITQPAANTVRFAAPNRLFIVNGGAITSGATGDLSLTGINSLTVNTAAGNDTIAVTGPISPLPDLTLNGGTGDDRVTLAGSLPLTTGANLNVDLLDDDASPGVDAVTLSPGAQVAASGSGAITIRCSRNVTVGAGANLETVDGDLVVEANLPPAAAIPGNFVGVLVDGGMVRATGTGQVSIAGRGGNDASGSQFGVYVLNGGSVVGGTSGTVHLDGVGGASTGFRNTGVRVSTGTPVSSLGANVLVTGLGGGDPLVAPALAVNVGVIVTDAAQVTAGGTATVTVQGTGGSGPGSNNYGVGIQLSGVVTSGGGDVTVLGQGGASPFTTEFAAGMAVNGGLVTAGGNGAVNLQGTGGPSSGNNQHGLEVLNGGQITSSGGPVTVTGIAGSGAGQSQFGVTFLGGSVTSGGGPVTVTGTGGSGAGQAQVGVLLGPGSITSGGGPVTIAGYAGAGTGNTNNGVHLQQGSMISSGGGNVSITGTYGNGASAGFVCINDGSNVVSTVANGGDIEIATDLMAWGSLGRIAAPADARILFRPLTPGREVSVYKDPEWAASGALAMTDDMLNLVNAGAIEMGSEDAGDLYLAGALVYQPVGAVASPIPASAESDIEGTVLAGTSRGTRGPRLAQGPKTEPDLLLVPVVAVASAIDAAVDDPQPARAVESAIPAAAQAVTSNFIFRSGGDILIFGAPTLPDGFDTGGGNLNLAPGPGKAVVPAAQGTDVTSTGFTMAPGTTLKCWLDTTVPDTGYQLLRVGGLLDLTGVSLAFDGTYTPVAGDTFRIVRNGVDPTTGTFVGLPEGSLIPNFMGSALSAAISYLGGDDDDVQLVITSGTIAVPEPETRVLPTRSGLNPARPSPFVSSTTLSFALATSGHAELAIFSVDGRRVRTLASGAFAPGEYQRQWDGRGDDGGRVPAGVYFVRLTTPHGDFRSRLVLLN